MDSIKARLFGRKTILQDLVQGVLAPSQPLDYSLVGPRMIGKSRLLKYLASNEGPLKNPDYADWRPERFQDGHNIIIGHFDCDWPEAQTYLTDFIYQQLRLQLKEENDPIRNWNLIEQATSPGQKIGQIIRQLNQEYIRLVLLLDNFDHVLRSDSVTSDMINELRPLTKELGLVVATEQPLHDLNQTLAQSPLFNVMHQHFVGLLEPTAAREWIEAYHRRLPFAPEIKEFLFELTGGHPFLLARVNDIITEMQPVVAQDTPMCGQHMPLIRLRLAEHGRPLFETIWRRLKQEEKGPEALNLVKELLAAPIKVGDVPTEKIATLNWLINQAIVTYTQNHYHLFSPLLGRFLPDKLQAGPQSKAAFTPMLTNNYADFLAKLPPKEAELLRYLQNRSNTVVTFEQLLADVWHRPHASVRRVQEAVRRLRNSLSETSPPIGAIENERGVGYKYIPTNQN